MAPVTPCYRGFLAHSANGGHPCPGPLFDWHRFAREVSALGPAAAEVAA